MIRPVGRPWIQHFFCSLFLGLCFSFLFQISEASADENEPLSLQVEGVGEILYRSDRLRLSVKDGVADLIGQVEIIYGEQCLLADRARIYQKTGRVVAEGNIQLNQAEATITGTRMDYNLKTGLGTITNGRVSNRRYSLSGELLEKLGEKRYVTRNGEYSTCIDCPKSWTMYGRNVDMEMGGYAEITGMMLRVSEVPLFYFPYLVFPVKSDRQSGLLFPQLGSSEEHGFRLTIPYYWAISRSQDATFYAGDYSKRGPKFGAEHRWILDAFGSQGEARAWAIRDTRVVEGEDILRPYKGWRWSGELDYRLMYNRHWSSRFNIREISDTAYLREFNDLGGRGSVALESSLDLDFNSRDDFWVNLSAHRYRSLLAPKVDDPSEREFPWRTVQVLPELNFGFRRVSLFDLGDHGSLDFDAKAWLTRFWRRVPEGGGDSRYWELLPENDESGNPIRATRMANRYLVAPQLSADYRFFDRFLIRPSLTEHWIYYQFPEESFPSAKDYTLTRWSLLQLDLETTLQKIFDSEKEHVSDTGELLKYAYKHEITPKVGFSRITSFDIDESHPFQEQLTAPGGSFDDDDLIPLSGDGVVDEASSAALPLEKTMTFSLRNRVIEKKENLDQDTESFRRLFDWSISQAIDLARYDEGSSLDESLSRLRSIVRLNTEGGWSFSSDLNYYHRTDSRVLSNSVQKLFANEEKDLFLYRRAVGLQYAYNDLNRDIPAETIGPSTYFSFNDYFATRMVGNYSLTRSQWYSWSVQLKYTDPSRCWELAPTLSWERDTQDTVFTINLAINLTGESLLSLSDIYGT
jgi:LPS-assembly protein